jgi:hypothetical protein
MSWIVQLIARASIFGVEDSGQLVRLLHGSSAQWIGPALQIVVGLQAMIARASIFGSEDSRRLVAASSGPPAQL